MANIKHTNTSMEIDVELKATKVSVNNNEVYHAGNLSTATTSTNGLMTSSDKTKLDTIATGATNYSHPDTHPATMIVEDSTHKFVTDTEKTTWNNKAEVNYVDTKVASVVNSAPETLNTLNELATSLGNDPNFATTIATQIGLKANSADVYTKTANDALLANKVDKVTGKDLSTNDYTTAEKTKLSGIETNANNYVHPSTHAATIITEDALHRFLTDVEKTKLSGIAANANNYTHPANHSPSIITQDVNNRFVTDAEKTAWNGKANSVDVYTKNTSDTLLNNKVDKVTGKGLSTEDYTTVEKTKLAGIEVGANNYIHPATHSTSMITGLSNVATSGSYNDLINKPTIPTTLPANGGNADTVDGKHATDFTPASHIGSNGAVHAAATQSTAGFISATDKMKLDGVASSATLVADSATNGNIKINGVETIVYTHPANHSPSIITEDSNNRFVTDTQISNWDAKLDATANAVSATKLATARTINGVNFDGTANITIADSTKLPLTGGTLTGNVTSNADIQAASLSTSLTWSRTFYQSFGSVANQKFDMYWTGEAYGTIEVEITGGYNYGNAIGKILKRFVFGGSATGSAWTNIVEKTEVVGTIKDNFGIGDISWDATNSRWKFTIAQRSGQNAISIRIKILASKPDHLTAWKTMTMSAIYTTDTTDIVNVSGLWNNDQLLNAGNVGIGTTSPTSPLHIIKTATDTSITTAQINLTPTTNTTGSYTNYGLTSTVSPTVATGITNSGIVRGLYSTAWVNSATFAGTLANMYGVHANTGFYDLATSGTITNDYGLSHSLFRGCAGATITNAYGLYLSSTSTSTAVTNWWDIYAGNASAKSYFAGNVGIGTDITKAWHTGYKVLQLGGKSNLYAHNNTTSAHLLLANNVYNNASDTSMYMTTNAATRYIQNNDGSHKFQVAQSGTVDTAIAFTDALILANNGAATFANTVNATTFVGALTGNASTATKLQTARTINDVSFDGTTNITVADATKLPLTGGTLTGNLNGTTIVANQFVGALSGNATSATMLTTTRTINGVSFNGMQDITIADATKLPLTGGTLTGNLIISNTNKTLTIIGTNGRTCLGPDSISARTADDTAFSTLLCSSAFCVNGKTTLNGALVNNAMPVYANNAAAITGGLTVGTFYRTGTDPDHVCVVH